MNRNISGRVKAFVYTRDRGRCVYCGSSKNVECDHIIPVSKGGSNTERNIQLVCFDCNREKYDYIDDHFLYSLRRKKKKRISRKESYEIKISEDILNQLDWIDGDSISCLIESINRINELGIFLVKNRKRGYQTIFKGIGIIFIPNAMAECLSWNHKDDINITIEVIDGQKGLFLFKKED